MLPRTELMDSRYQNPDNDPRGLWQSDNFSVKTYSSANDYQITTPSGRTVNPPGTSCWRLSKDRFAEYLADNRIWFGPNGNNVPRIKRFLIEVQQGTVCKTIWTYDEVGHNQEAKNELIAFDSKNAFATPKPERLIQRIIHLATNPGDLVLDSFAGSGTTGAVAQKMGRRWIMVELGDHCHTHIIPRLKKVIDGSDQGGISKAVDWKGGGGFRYFRLAPSLLEKDSRGNWIVSREYNATMLAEAMCKHMGFTYEPSSEIYWQHGRSTETDYIYVTTQTLAGDTLHALSEEVGEQRTLLVCCAAYTGSADRYANLTLTKIPNAILHKCEFGHDDYGLEVEDLPQREERPETPGRRNPEINLSQETLEL